MLSLGGALYSALTNSAMRIVDCDFSSNIASQYGGAIYFGEYHYDTLFISNSTVEDNRAQRGGGETHLCIFLNLLC